MNATTQSDEALGEPLTDMDRWVLMVARIPCLRGIAGGTGNDPAEIYKQLVSMGLCRGKSMAERLSATFMVEIYSGGPSRHVNMDLPVVDLIEIASRCDSATRRVVSEYIADPIWP
ncbi:MAG: hypothetical protein AAF958_12930 [Planctomycetota bacterium]